MGLLNKKKQEDEWELLPDDFDYDDYDEFVNVPKETKPKEKPSKKQVKTKEPKSKKNKERNKEKPKNQRPEVYDDENVNSYDYDDIDYLEKESGYIYVNKERPKNRISKVWIIAVTVVLSIASLGIVGYINTDFDDSGTAYVIPLDIHYKRKYAQMSDNVLDYINEINDDIQDNIINLPNSYLVVSDNLTKQVDTLKSKTNELSRYTSIPKDFKSYHSSLLNFSLLTQEFLTNLINNYSSASYEEFAYNGMSDFRSYLSEMNSLRVQMDSVLFSNQKGFTTEYQSKKKTTKKKTTDSSKSYFNTSESKSKSDK